VFLCLFFFLFVWFFFFFVFFFFLVIGGFFPKKKDKNPTQRSESKNAAQRKEQTSTMARRESKRNDTTFTDTSPARSRTAAPTTAQHPPKNQKGLWLLCFFLFCLNYRVTKPGHVKKVSRMVFLPKLDAILREGAKSWETKQESGKKQREWRGVRVGWDDVPSSHKWGGGLFGGRRDKARWGEKNIGLRRSPRHFLLSKKGHVRAIGQFK